MTAPIPKLVDAAWLRENLDNVTVLDCTTFMTPQPVGPSKITSGRTAYGEGHIPGALHVEMVDDLSDPAGDYPYTLPQPEQVAAVLGRLGITADDHLVLYSAAGLGTATRAWYVLRTMGHQRLSLLDGGLTAWRDAGYPLSTTPPEPTPTSYTAVADPRRIVTADEVQQALDDQSAIVVNSLSAQQHAGTGGAQYGRPGHITGSVNVPNATLTDEHGRFRSPEELRAAFAAAGVTDQTPVITYCGGGIAATVDAFALDLIGHDAWSVYDNSLLEWAADPNRPMETG